MKVLTRLCCKPSYDTLLLMDSSKRTSVFVIQLQSIIVKLLGNHNLLANQNYAYFISRLIYENNPYQYEMHWYHNNHTLIMTKELNQNKTTNKITNRTTNL